VMPIIFIAAIDAMARIGAARGADDPATFARASGSQGVRRAALAGARRYGAAMMLAITVLLAFQFPLSTLWNAQAYRISSHVKSAEAAMAQVPDGATVQATLDLLAPLAARTDAFWIGNGGNPTTQYIVFDAQDSGYTPAISNVPAFIAQIYPGRTYAKIFQSGDVYVFRRTAWRPARADGHLLAPHMPHKHHPLLFTMPGLGCVGPHPHMTQCQELSGRRRITRRSTDSRRCSGS